MKKFWKITGRIALGLLLTVYVAVAMMNYSVVQSFAGRMAGNYFSKEWGGTVRIGSLHAMPWDHLLLDEVLLVAPDGDTIFDGESLHVTFRRFPFHDNGLDLRRVSLRNAYYHFESRHIDELDKNETNLQFIIDHYKPKHKKTKKKHHEPFTVQVETLVLNGVHYKMDLPDHRKDVPEHGVQIPHMEFYDIRGRFKGVRVVNDDVTVRIVKLSTEERSGFKVDKIAGRVHVSSYEIVAHDMDIKTPKSHILLDADLTYDHWDEMKDYLRTVMHRAVIKEGTTVAMSDIAYWAPVLWGIDAQLRAEGTAEGPINALRTEGLHVGYGLATEVDVAGSIEGLPLFDTTVIDIGYLAVRSEEADMRHMMAGLGPLLPPEVERWIGRVGYIDLRASGRGGMNMPTAVNIDLGSGMGNLKADARLTPTQHGGWKAGVDAESDGIALGWLGSDWLTRTGAALSVDATVGNTKDMRSLTAEMDGELTGCVVRGRQLEPIALGGKMRNGVMEVTVASVDTTARFDLYATADMLDSVHRYGCELDLQRLDAEAFDLLPARFGEVSTRLRASLEGRDADDMGGTLRAVDTRMGDARMKYLSVELEGDGRAKHLDIESDALNASLDGQFAYADLPLMLRHFCAEVLPADMVQSEPLDSVEMARVADNTMNLKAVWNDQGDFIHAINENLTIAPGTRLSGSYNSSEQLKLVLRGDSLTMGGLALAGIGLSTRPSPEGYVLDAESQEIRVGKTELMRRVGVVLNSNRSRALAEVAWGDYGDPTRGDLMLRLQDGDISVMRPGFYIGDDQWTLSTDSMRLDIKEGISARNIGLESQVQRIGASLSLQGKDNDKVEMDFSHFDIGRLSRLLLQNTAVSVGGTIDGHFSMYGLTTTPYFNANLTVDSCVVNRQPLGDVAVRSNWNAELNTLNLTLGSDQIGAHGWIGLGKKDPDLNFAVDFNGFELALIAPLMSSFSSRFEGQLHGNFDIAGTATDPVILGEAMVENGALKVDMTDVTYYFSDSLRFDNNTVSLDRFKVLDPRGNIAYVDGTIGYRGMSNLELDLRVETDNLLVLDQRRGSQFYGTLLASATGDITGRIDDLSVSVQARTNPGCSLTVPVSNQRQMKSQNYITFVSDSPAATGTAKKKRKSRGKFNIELDLAISPDVQLNLPMDFSEVGVTVGANGNGDLHLSLDGDNTPQVLGNYEITNGTMKLSLLSIVEKSFTIESGSSLNFQGSLPDARFDMKAVYSQRVNLSSLTGNLSTVDNTQKYIQVEDIISVSGTLQDPTIGFDLRLPNADQSVEDEVFAYIDRNSERDMLNQTLSLLVSGQFYNVNGNNNTGTATGGGIGALASTLGNALTDMVDFVDINVDYKSATEMTNEQIDVNISRDWGRWYLESTLGYGGDSREIESTNAGGAVLDALVGYRISPLVHIFAYNRTNNNDYTRLDLPYKQGVGLKLSKDFDRWSELFGHPKKKKTEKEKKK